MQPKDFLGISEEVFFCLEKPPFYSGDMKRSVGEVNREMPSI